MSLYRALVFGWALSWSLLAVQGQGQDNTTCKYTSLDWYTSVVGETPCKTYESLRLLCRDSYTLPILSTPMTAASPGFQCNEEIYGAPQDCCCNSIAYSLGALCINCQQGTGFEQNGSSEPPEAYTTYLNGCSPVTDRGFTATGQNLVCGSNLKIADGLYNVFTSNGSWTYTEVHEQILQSFAATGNNSFTHCSSTSTNITSAIPAQPSSTDTTSSKSAQPSSINTTSSIPAQPSSTNTPTPTEHSALSGGAIGGIVVGTLAVLALAGFIVWLCVRRHRGSAAAIHQITARQMAHINY